jgi:signal transduction histidine kinase
VNEVFRARWQLGAATVLVLLLVALGALQYRWLGELSAAEGERMKASLAAHVAEFTTAFNAELTRTYAVFQVDDALLARSPGATLAEAYQRWREEAPATGLIRSIYLLGPDAENGAERLRRLDVERRQLDPAAWPGELLPWRDAVDPASPLHAGMLPMPVREALDADVPALMVTIVRPQRSQDRPGPVGRDLPVLEGVVIVVFDRDQLQRGLIEPLMSRYFGAGPQSAYVASIVRREQPSAVVYASDSSAPLIGLREAEAVTTLFELRMDDLARLVKRRPREGRERLAITVLRRPSGRDDPQGDGTPVDRPSRVDDTDAGEIRAAETHNVWFGGSGPGGWELRVRHRAGPLDAIVSQSRRRNLAISLGVLGLLGASMVMVIVGARRQHQLSQQQLEFVAAVSHELRTPLAVICAAGENLADGVASEAAQVRTYGNLIGAEGRRLTSMVDRVMDFAGMSSGQAVFARLPVCVSTVIEEAVREVRRESPADAAAIRLQAVDPCWVSGDRDALRSAFQNILGNAVKYSVSGADVVVSAEAVGALLRIRVIDGGMGIDQDEMAHLFKPFYRGRRAIAAQVRGSGIGLSVVRHVVVAHGGRVEIESRAGRGTTVTMLLPLATEAASTESSSPASVSPVT